jgi:hypothetical protein
VSVSAEPTVSQREFDEYKEHQRELREADLRERAQIRDDLSQLRTERDDDIKAAVALAVAAAFKELGADRRATLGQRIAGIAAGASVVAAWVGLFELWHSLAH